MSPSILRIRCPTEYFYLTRRNRAGEHEREADRRQVERLEREIAGVESLIQGRVRIRNRSGPDR